MSEREFAKHTGRAFSTVQEARKSGRLQRCISRDAKGRIRIDPVVAAEEWLANTQLRVTEGGGSVVAWRSARARREAALAALAEDELRRSRGELVEVAGVVQELTSHFANARTKLLGVPTRVRQQDPTLTVQQLAAVEAAIREALEDLAQHVAQRRRAHGR